MKTLKKILLILFGIACFLAAAFVLLMAYASFTSPEIGPAFGMFCLLIVFFFGAIGYFSIKKSKSSVVTYEFYKSSNVPVSPDIDPFTPAGVPDPVSEIPAEAPPVKKEDILKIKPVIDEPTESKDSTEEKHKSNSKTFVFPVAGLFYRQDDFVDSLLLENPDYEMSKSEIIDSCLEEEKIYKYDVFYGLADLVPEPDNQYDPNAIKIIVDNIHIGYVPAKYTKNVFNILNNNKIGSISCEIFGGPYKILFDEDSSIQKESAGFKSNICIEYT